MNLVSVQPSVIEEFMEEQLQLMVLNPVNQHLATFHPQGPFDMSLQELRCRANLSMNFLHLHYLQLFLAPIPQ